jgi:16S rRNA (guanine527-N7)-methyltransferase
MEATERILTEGLAAMNLPAASAQREQLLAFLRLLRKWNRVFNLTAIHDPADMARLHLLDSLSLLPYVSGARVLDVGTGAGLPGIPLAVLAPQRAFALLDSDSKKTRFVRQAAIELGLGNVEVVHARIERFQPEQGFDVILTRAYASLPRIVEQTSRLLNPGGVILAQKGKPPEEELSGLSHLAVETFPLTIPGVNAARHLIAIKIQG